MAKTLIGKVSSAKADKTITITVTSRETHPIYGKQYTVNRKYIAHDENNDANEGDLVQIEETRPISKRKSFALKEIIKRSKGAITLKDEVNEAVEDKIDHDHEESEEDK
jgi:small subunit ribosomal protein S17